MAKSNETRRERRLIEQRKKKFGPLIKKLEEFDVRLQIVSGKLGQLSVIMRNFTVCIMVLKDKGLLNDEEIGAKDAELRAAHAHKDSENPEGSIIQPEGAGDNEGDLSDGGRTLSGESNTGSSGGVKSIEGTRDVGSISGEDDTSDTPSSIGGDE